MKPNKKLERYAAEREKRKAERSKYEAEGNTFMLGLLDIREQKAKLTPYETFSRQLRLIFEQWARRMMAKTGTCPCCGQAAPSKAPTSAQ